MYCFGNIAVICHPKTASRSLAEALGWERVGHHHEMKLPLPENVISVIREPEDWYTSWYFHQLDQKQHTPEQRPFRDWLRYFTENVHWSKLAFYALPHTTHLVFYKNLSEGINAALESLGQPAIELPVLNRKGRTDEEFFTDETRRLLDPELIKTYTTLEKRLGVQAFLER